MGSVLAHIAKKLLPTILLLAAFVISAGAKSTPVWESAETIRKHGLSAQTALFRSNPDRDAITTDLAAMQAVYETALQSDIAAASPASDTAITAALNAAQTAGNNTDGATLALARGQLWTHMLHGSYAVTLAALDAGDTAQAIDWLRLREYRRSTIVNLVTSPADAVMQQVLLGNVTPSDAKLIVDADLRDTTFFRLREALNELDEAVASEFATRSAEWIGKAQGYFALLESDYVTKQGAAAANDIRTQLATAATAAIGEDWATLTIAATAVRSGLADYQPIAFTEAQLAERGQLLYLYTELVWIEYRDAVRNGEISIDIEYQETVTFRNQAETIFEELRPNMDEASAERLAAIFIEIEDIVAVIGPRADVEPLVEEALGLIETGLSVDTSAADAGASLSLINTLLTDMLASVQVGDYGSAENTRIEAYAFFETGPEVKLANRAPRMAREIEGIFWEGTGGEEGLSAMIRSEESLETISARVDTLRTKLDESEAFLSAETSSTVTILSSAAIIIREGLEAVLIVGAIIGFMRASNETKKYAWWVGGGVLAAIVLSILMWIGANTIFTISFANRELLEGLTALVAVAVLFYVTNWLFQKVYVRDWMTFVKEQVGNALTSGSALGLAFLGFTVVFREGFETVLFYQTLLFDSDPQLVGIGFVGGLILILIVAYLILYASVRLPLKPFFTVTTFLLLWMAVGFVGKGFRGLQEAGVVNATWLSWMPENLWLIELLGIYPTVETSFAQLCFVLLVAATFAWSLRQGRQERKLKEAAATQ